MIFELDKFLYLKKYIHIMNNNMKYKVDRIGLTTISLLITSNAIIWRGNY